MTPRRHAIDPRDPSAPAPEEDELRSELHELARGLTLGSLAHLIRLLESGKFAELTSDQIRTVGEYRSIEVGGEPFFDEPFSTGKEAAGSLGFARTLGSEQVLEDLRRLNATLTARAPAPEAS